MGILPGVDILPNGYMTVGYSERVEKVAKCFFSRGIDVRRHYVLDCSDIGFGDGATTCTRVADRLFHIPNRADFTPLQFAQYLIAIEKVLRDVRE
jgi:hypothetical protein